MKISASQTNGQSAIKVEGDLLITDVVEAKPKIVAAMAASSQIQLDLGELGQCDTAGIQLLLMACVSARAQGKRIAVIAQSAAFRAAIERIGIPVGYFECSQGVH